MSTNNQIEGSERKSISIVLPCYNESDNTDELHDRLTSVVGEHVCAALTHVKKRPLVIEKERIGSWKQ